MPMPTPRPITQINPDDASGVIDRALGNAAARDARVEQAQRDANVGDGRPGDARVPGKG